MKRSQLIAIRLFMCCGVFGACVSLSAQWTPLSPGAWINGGVGIGAQPLPTAEMLQLLQNMNGWPLLKPAIRIQSQTGSGEFDCFSTAELALETLGGQHSAIAQPGDLVLRTTVDPQFSLNCARDIILSANTPQGAIHFTTFDNAAQTELERMTIANNGAVGIGVSNPGGTGKLLNIRADDLQPLKIEYTPGADWTFGVDIAVSGQHVANTKALNIGSGDIPGVTYDLFTVWGNGNFWSFGDGRIMGKLRIGAEEYDGTGLTAPLALSVDGSIAAEEILVTLVNWADFVFDEDYELPTLQEVESHIKQNGHLPGIPSEEEVKKDGVNLADMQVKLLQKVEELTLYVIDLKNENSTLRERVAQIEGAGNHDANAE